MSCSKMGKSARSAFASSFRSVLTATDSWYVAGSGLRVPGSIPRAGGGIGPDAGAEARAPAGRRRAGPWVPDDRRPEQRPDHPRVAGEEGRLEDRRVARPRRRVLLARLPVDLD